VRRATWLALAVAALAALAQGWLLGRARAVESARPDDDIRYIPSGEALRTLSCGFDDMVADLLWFRVIQYYGAYRHGEHGIEFFERLVDVVLELDPNFEDAYRFAAQVLAEDMAAPDRGIALLERGMRVRPESWWLPFEAGFIEYTVNLDDEAAAAWFRRAAATPGAGEFPKRFAAFVAARAGQLEVSYELWSYIARTTDNPALRQKAEDYVRQLHAAIFEGEAVPEWATRRRQVRRGA
jgi:hypothetical protein